MMGPTGRSSSYQSKGGANRPPPVPKGRIVHLEAPQPLNRNGSKKRTQSLNIPHDVHPGLAVLVPEELIRKQSLQNDSLQQLQKLRLELLGERKQQRMDILFQDENIKDGQSPLHGAGRIRSGLSLTTPNSMYSKFDAGDGVGSSLSCVSAGQISHDLAASEQVMAGFTGDHKGANRMELAVSAEPAKPKEKPYELARTSPKKSQTTTQSFMTIVKKAKLPKKDEGFPDAQPFDIQKSLQSQLAGLPGARLPGMNAQSFDDHSYIISSGTKSVCSKDSKTDQTKSGGAAVGVAVVPCESFTPSKQGADNRKVMARTLSKGPKNRNKPKRILPKKAETVRIDKGLICVDPYNLNQQTKETFQPKPKFKELRGPAKQVGKVVEAVDLMQNDKNKGLTMVKLGSKLKDMVPYKFKASWSGSRSGKKSSNAQQEEFKTNSQEPTSECTPDVSEGSEDERLWKQQTMEQENYKITKVLGSPKKGSHSIDPTVAESAGSCFAGNSRELVMAAEGKSPMYKVPDGQATTPKQLIPDRHADDKRMPVKKLIKLAQRRKQKEMLQSIMKAKAERRGETKTQTVVKPQTAVLPEPLTKQPSIKARVGSLSSNSSKRIGIQQFPPTLEQNVGDSFCLSPSYNSFGLDRSLTDLASIFAKENQTGRFKALLEEQSLKEGKKNSGETKRQDESDVKGDTQSEAMREAREALMHSLKRRIVTELKKHKIRELEAKMKGETVSSEERAAQLEIVRRLHVRREALQHLSDSEIKEAFKQRLQHVLREEQKQKAPGSGGKSKPFGQGDQGAASRGSNHSNGNEEEDSNRKRTVSFAQLTQKRTISPRSATSCSEASDDDDDNNDDDDDDDDDIVEDDIVDEDGDGSHTAVSELTSTSVFSRGALMALTQCGAGAAGAVDGCLPDLEKQQQMQLETMRALADKRKASKSTKDAASTSSRSQNAAIRDKISAPSGFACGVQQIPEGSHDEYESYYDSDSSASQSSASSASRSRRRHHRKHDRRKASSKDDRRRHGHQKSSRRTDVLSDSEESAGTGRSRRSYETRETRDSRRTEYTEDTRDSRDSYETRETRDSRFSYDSRGSYGTRSLDPVAASRRRSEDPRSRKDWSENKDWSETPRSRKDSRHHRKESSSRQEYRRMRSNLSNSVAGTEFMSEYTEDRYDDGMLRCG